jgi:hypothetical protein
MSTNSSFFRPGWMLPDYLLRISYDAMLAYDGDLEGAAVGIGMRFIDIQRNIFQWRARGWDVSKVRLRRRLPSSQPAAAFNSKILPTDHPLPNFTPPDFSL